jgi:hypothetical protein
MELTVEGEDRYRPGRYLGDQKSSHHRLVVSLRQKELNHPHQLQKSFQT